MKGFAIGFLNFLLFLSLSSFGVVFALQSTILKPDFVTAELDKLDVTSLTREFIGEQLIPQIPPEAGFAAEAIDKTITELDPWTKEQVNNVVSSGYDYLLGRSQELNLVIQLEPVKETFRDNLWAAFIKSPPPEVSILPQAELEKYFDQFYQQFAEQVPSTFELRQSTMPREVTSQLEIARDGIGYAQSGYNILIGIIIFLILAIILIDRSVKGTTRVLGTTFLIYGAFQYAGILAIRYFALPQLAQLPIPVQIQAWLPEVVSDFVAPMETLSLGLAIAGAVLLIVSFVYKPRVSY